uniref:Uncharacterized protein LOC112812512 n=1 Tax=Callorhinus ursinus TaxID=34884 RepID=A0A3Q7PBA5_CALUR|nr:uncharacterized protein LOC112812512 [Callorhinus ursinus]
MECRRKDGMGCLGGREGHPEDGASCRVRFGGSGAEESQTQIQRFSERLGEFGEDGRSGRARRTPYSGDRVCEWSGQGNPSPAHGRPMRPASAPEAVGLASLGRSRRAERTSDPRVPHGGGSLRAKTAGSEAALGRPTNGSAARPAARAPPPSPAECEPAVNGGAAGPRLQNKGQAARGAAAGGCLAPCRGANGRSASRAAPAPPESRARADRGPGRMGAAGRGADRRAAVSTGGPGHCCAGGYFVATRGSCDCGRGRRHLLGVRAGGRGASGPHLWMFLF